MIDGSLGLTVKVFGCFMPEDHPVYGLYMRSMCNITIQGLIKELGCYKLCCSVEVTEICGKLYHHVVHLAEDPLESSQSQPFPHKGCWRYKNCELLCAKDEIPACCSACTDYLCQLKRSKAIKESRQKKPAHLKAPMARNLESACELTASGFRKYCRKAFSVICMGKKLLSLSLGKMEKLISRSLL